MTEAHCPTLPSYIVNKQAPSRKHCRYNIAELTQDCDNITENLKALVSVNVQYTFVSFDLYMAGTT